MFIAQGVGGMKRPSTQSLAAPAVSSDFETAWYLRFFVRDQPGIVARLAQILADDPDAALCLIFIPAVIEETVLASLG